MPIVFPCVKPIQLAEKTYRKVQHALLTFNGFRFYSSLTLGRIEFIFHELVFMHALFEYLPLVIFFVFYKFQDVYWATASLIVTSALQIIYFMAKKQPVPKRNLIFFGLIVVFGGLTIFFQNDAFLKWKVTIINGIFALVLIVSNYVFNKNLLKQLVGENLTLPEHIWSRLNLSWALFFIFCGLLNIYIADNYPLDTWVNFKVFGLTVLTFIFAIGSVASLYKYLPKEEANKESSLPTNNEK